MKAQVQRGFTLIELMIVVAIIAILASIALPAYQDYLGRAQLAEALTLVNGAKTAVTESYTNNGVFPVTNAAAGIAAADKITGKYVLSVTVGANGVITALMKGEGVSAGILGKNLVLTPAAVDGAINWTCSSTADDRYLPTNCRKPAQAAAAPKNP